MRIIIIFSAIILFIAACSKSSDEVSAVYVSPSQYANYGCPQLTAEMSRVSTRVSQLSGTLDDNAETDGIVTGAGIILFWPALFFLGGTKEEEAEYARLKGEYTALEQSYLEKGCSDYSG